MNKHLLLSILTASAFATTAHADPISFKAAQQKAAAFWQTTFGTPHRLKAAASTREAQPYYIFNDDEHGFVVVAGDDAVPAVLAYSAQGHLSTDSIPTGLKALLASYARQISLLQQGYARPLAEGAEDFHGSKQLNTALWGQTGYYAQSTPLRAPTGCVATALAIIMKYHGHPTQPQGRTIYYSDYGSRYVKVDFAQSHYDFDSMPMEKKSGSASADFKGVAKLMSDIGAAVGMTYTATESSAINGNIAPALQSYFSYSPETQLRSASYYSNEEWLGMVREEIDNGCPVFYTGDEKGGSHAYVVDGYKDRLFSINWGWDGQFNGYYAIGSLIADGEQTKYNENAAALFHLRPMTEKRANATIETEEAGTLADRAAALDGTLVDTLVVKGPLNMNDLNSLKRISALHVDASDSRIVTFNNYYEDNTIFDMAFYGYRKVWTLICPRDVTSVGRDAFRASEDLSTVVLPSGVTSIADKAFGGCSRLLDLTVLSPTPPALGSNVFDSCPCPSQGTLHVPHGSRSAYLKATGWKAFRKIVEDADEGIYTAIHEAPDAGKGGPDVRLDGQTLHVLTAGPVAIYSASGRRVSTAHEVDLPQGVYVVNTAEGTTKVLVP